MKLFQIIEKLIMQIYSARNKLLCLQRSYVLILVILSGACIRIEKSPLDTSQNPAALAASYLLNALIGKSGGGAGNSSSATGSFPMDIAVNPSANLIYITNNRSNTVTYLNAKTGAYLNGTLANSSFTTGTAPVGGCCQSFCEYRICSQLQFQYSYIL